MILELHERDTEVLEQILSILKNHPEIEKFEIDEEPMVSLPGLEIFPSRRKVWGDFTTGNENNTIGFHICNLREKLYRANPDAPFYIRSVREVGYCLDVDEP